MKWSIEEARNGQKILKLNDTHIYSQYNPLRAVETYMETEIRVDTTEYVLIGIGLGYHLDYLVERVPNSIIRYVFLDAEEERLYSKYNTKQYIRLPNVQPLNNQSISNTAHIIVPQSYVRAVENGDQPVLHQFLQDIKIRQASYKKREKQLIENFEYNISYFQPLSIEYNNLKKSAALVSAGPSLDDTASFLKSKAQELDIYCVGSALRVLLQHDIVPEAVVITDPLDGIVEQIPLNYTGQLYFLSTANYRAVQQHKGEKQILFQEGFDLAEAFAKEYKQPLFSTGGSVATTTFSFIEWLGYKEVYLFGQDLGFSAKQIHAKNSTSNREVGEYQKLIEVVANDGSIIHTTPNLLTYKRWFDQAFKNSDMRIYNTAEKGAKLSNTIFILLNNKESD